MSLNHCVSIDRLRFKQIIIDGIGECTVSFGFFSWTQPAEGCKLSTKHLDVERSCAPPLLVGDANLVQEKQTSNYAVAHAGCALSVSPGFKQGRIGSANGPRQAVESNGFHCRTR